MSTHTYQYNVKMACGGCSGAIDRVLKKTEGVKSIDISLPEQTVKVSTDESLSYDRVLEVIKKTGKEVISGQEILAKEEAL